MYVQFTSRWPSSTVKTPDGHGGSPLALRSTTKKVAAKYRISTTQLTIQKFLSAPINLLQAAHVFQLALYMSRCLYFRQNGSNFIFRGCVSSTSPHLSILHLAISSDLKTLKNRLYLSRFLWSSPVFPEAFQKRVGMTCLYMIWSSVMIECTRSIHS